MPRGDGTGPMGQGPATGRGLGGCDPVGQGTRRGGGGGNAGGGRGRGQGRGRGGGQGQGGGRGRGMRGQ